LLIAAWVGAGLLLLVDLTLSVSLVSISGLSRVGLRRMASESETRLGFLEHMSRPTSRHRSSAILLRQICLVGSILLITLALRGAGWAYAEVIGAGAGVLIGILLLEALLARSLALWNPRGMLRSTAFALGVARGLLYPIVEPLHVLLDRIDRSRPRTEEEREVEQEEEVEAYIEVGEREGLLEAEEGEMMRGIVDLDDTRVRELMTPRTDIVALPVETTVADARRTVLEAGHSRLPVYRGSIDNVVGVLLARDLFRAWEAKLEQQTVSQYLRPAIFVPETLSAAELLADMRQKMHLALVVDEYGGTAGLVTLEDVLEEIVGEIQDEHEEGEELIRQQADGSWIINAVTHVDELASLFGVEFEERDFDTVGGMVVSAFGRVPVTGETQEVRGLHVEVLQADRRRVQRVRVRPADRSGGAQAGR
jgi:CBS domain containing-hemolysin-like protein